jgi:hypothetical protein
MTTGGISTKGEKMKNIVCVLLYSQKEILN